MLFRVMFRLSLLVFFVLCAGNTSAWAAGSVEVGSEPRFGPYRALAIDPTVVEGVRVDEGRIYLMLTSAAAEHPLRMKISMENGSIYRKWYTGEEVLIAPPNPDRGQGEWTDWIKTESSYIEYWMDGHLILHLHKAG